MRFERTFALMMTSVSILVLSGCIKYDDSIEIDSLGKGTATIVISRPVLGAFEKAKNYEADQALSEDALSKNLPTGVTATYSTHEENDRKEFKVVYTFEDINTLIGWAAQKKEHPLRDISVTRTESSIEFTRSFHPKKEMLEAARKFMPDAVFTFRLKGPGSIQAQNATHVENGVLVWEIKPASLDENGKQLKAAFYFGTPTWVYALIAFAIIGPLIVALIFVFRKKPAAAVPAA